MPLSQEQLAKIKEQLAKIKDTFDLVIDFKSKNKPVIRDIRVHSDLSNIINRLSPLPCYLSLEERIDLVCYILDQVINGRSEYICTCIQEYLYIQNKEDLFESITNESYEHLLTDLPHKTYVRDPYANDISSVVRINAFLPELIHYMPSELSYDVSWYECKYERVIILNQILKYLMEAYTKLYNQATEIINKVESSLWFSRTLYVPIHTKKEQIKEQLLSIRPMLSHDEKISFVITAINWLLNGYSAYICNIINKRIGEYNSIPDRKIIIKQLNSISEDDGAKLRIPVESILNVYIVLPELIDYIPPHLCEDGGWFINKYVRILILTEILKRLLNHNN